MSQFSRRTVLRLTASGMTAPFTSLSTMAQNSYPSRPIHLIVGFTPGTAADITARAFSNGAEGILGQTVVVEDKPGAGSRPYSSVMDAPNPSAIPTAASRAPVHIGAVGMRVRDIDRVTAYYRDMLGLTVQEHTGQVAILGVGGVALLKLIHKPDAPPDDQREAGLYHTAFLMPTRADLARWILHATKNRVPFTGASDHDVSEAIYLDDPEGNGVEVYSDRPRENWRGDGKLIFQKTDPLDIDAIVREIEPATTTYPSAPEGLRIGHIHLRVGNVAGAEAFYCGALGLDVTRRRTGATFLSSDGYHHHVAVNVWHSDGAATRNGKRAGLNWFAMEVNDQRTMDAVKKRLDAAGVTIDAIPGGLCSYGPLGHRYPFHRCALNAGGTSGGLIDVDESTAVDR